MKTKLEEIINDFNGKFKNNEVAGVNSIAEYYTDYTVQDFSEVETPENVADIVNKKLGTDFDKEDVEKIGKIVEAEMNNEIEPVGWDDKNNDIDINKINEIYDENKENLEKIENPFEGTNKKDIENEEDKQSLIENIAVDAFSELTEGLKNSENILDSAVGEMYDRWREEYLEEKEAEKKQEEIEEAFDKDEQNEQEADKNIEEKAQEEGQKEQQNKGEFAEAQAKEAVESIEIDAGMSM